MNYNRLSLMYRLTLHTHVFRIFQVVRTLDYEFESDIEILAEMSGGCGLIGLR